MSFNNFENNKMKLSVNNSKIDQFFQLHVFPLSPETPALIAKTNISFPRFANQMHMVPTKI